MFTRRPILPADAATIIGWFPDRQSSVFWGGSRAPEPLTAQWLVEEVEKYSCWVWSDGDGALAGTFGLVNAEAGRGHMVRFGLAPEFRKQGLGRRLFEDIIAMVRDHGMTQMSLNVFDSNAIARRLYEQRGFIVVERSPPFAEWSGDNLHMRLTF